MFQLLTYTERLLEHWCKPRPGSGFMCASSLLELIGRIYSFSHDRAMEQGSPNQIVMAKAKAYIESRVNQSLHMDALGQYVGMSKHHLARTFKEHYGVTPMQYHQHLRMEQAASAQNGQPHRESCGLAAWVWIHLFLQPRLSSGSRRTSQ